MDNTPLWWNSSRTKNKKENNDSKKDVEIVEALLLKVADEIGRFPKENTNKGKMKSIVHKIYHKYGLVRVIITGNDPLIGKKLNSSKRIWFEVDDDYDEVIVEHSWNSI